MQGFRSLKTITVEVIEVHKATACEEQNVPRASAAVGSIEYALDTDVEAFTGLDQETLRRYFEIP